MMENEYKAAWRAASGHRHVPRKQTSTSNQQTRSTRSMLKQVQKEMAIQAGIGLALGALPHMAQNQLKGRVGIALRLTGRVGMRAVPVVGTAMIVYDAYRFLDRMSDA